MMPEITLRSSTRGLPWFLGKFGGASTGKAHIVTAPDVQAVEHHCKNAPFFSTADLVNALEQERMLNKAGRCEVGRAIGIAGCSYIWNNLGNDIPTNAENHMMADAMPKASDGCVS